MSDPRIETFEKAFSTCTAGFTRECNCGKMFYDTHNHWDTTPEEFESLEKTACPLMHSVETIWLEGREYVMDCDCWKERGKQIMDWLDTHRDQITAYLNGERERLLREAISMQVVKTNAPNKETDAGGGG